VPPRAVRAAALALSIALAAAVAAAAGAVAPGTIGANPDDGIVGNAVYSDPYFALRYPLPAGWTAGPQPPRPSFSGYYVLDTPSPPPNAKATILIAAQDEFFAGQPSAEASVRDLAQSFAGPGHAIAKPTSITIAGHAFFRLSIPGTPLSRIVLATESRCHVVLFVFTGAEPVRLEALSRSVDHLTFAAGRAPPACRRGYATVLTIRHQVQPIPAGPRFVAIPVRIIIGADGRVQHIHVIRAAPEQRRNIADALAQWRFVPYLAEGHPAPVETGLTFDFKPAGG
jgi:hypothetical protein